MGARHSALREQAPPPPVGLVLLWVRYLRYLSPTAVRLGPVLKAVWTGSRVLCASCASCLSAMRGRSLIVLLVAAAASCSVAAPYAPLTQLSGQYQEISKPVNIWKYSKPQFSDPDSSTP